MVKDRIILFLSIIFFVFVSIVLYWYAPDYTAHFEEDSVRYNFIAQHFNFIKDVQLEVFGYPCFLALIYKVFGCSIGFVVLTQVLLSIICLFLLRKIAGRLNGIGAQTWITIFWAGNLGFLIYSQLLLIEVMLVLFYLWFIERVIFFYEEPSWKTIAQAAFILGLSILFRPAALFYALCFAPFLLFIGKKCSFCYKLVAAFIFIGIFYVPIFCYMSFNYWWFGQFVLCPVMNVNLFLFFYPKLLAVLRERGIPFDGLVAVINDDIVQKNITKTTQVNLIKVMLHYPFINLKIWLINMLKSVIGLYQTQLKLYLELSDQATSFFTLSGSWFSNMKQYICQGSVRRWLHMLGWYEVFYLIVQYFFAFIGALYLLAKQKIWLFVFALSFIIYFALITGPDGSGRFRMMFEPWLLVLAALGLSWWFCKNKEKAFL